MNFNLLFLPLMNAWPGSLLLFLDELTAQVQLWTVLGCFPENRALYSTFPMQHDIHVFSEKDMVSNLIFILRLYCLLILLLICSLYNNNNNNNNNNNKNMNQCHKLSIISQSKGLSFYSYSLKKVEEKTK